MPKRRRPRSTVEKWEWDWVEDVPTEISPKPSSPPLGYAPHRYGTRQASLFKKCVASASLRSKRAQRIVPRPNEINTTDLENLPLNVEHQTETTTNHHATEEVVHNATSSTTSKRPENEINTADSEDLPLNVEHQTETTNHHLATEKVVHNATSSTTSKKPENEINTADSEDLPLNVEHQTETTNHHATEEVVHNATSSTSSKRPEKEISMSAAASHPTRSDNFNLTEILHLVDCNDDEEVDSMQDPSRVNLDDRYKVKAETVPLIEKIFSRYGDIVEGSTPQTVEYRSSCLESVVSIYQRLDSVNLLDIASGELESMRNILKDLGIFKVEVGWLRERIEQIYEAKKFILKEAINLKAKKTKTLEEMEEKKTAIAATKRELGSHVEACRVLRKKLKRLEDDVGSAGIEIQKIDESYSSVKAKVKSFYLRPLVRDLLNL